jgi:hypothetical protein
MGQWVNHPRSLRAGRSPDVPFEFIVLSLVVDEPAPELVLLGELVDELSMLVPELDVPELEVPDVDELSVEPIVPDEVLEGDVVLGDWVVLESVLGEAEESVDELCA